MTVYVGALQAQNNLAEIAAAGSAAQAAAQANLGLGSLSSSVISLKGPTSTATYDAQISVPDGGSANEQGTLQLTAACVQALGSDGTVQWSTWTTPGAAEYWQAQGGVAGRGATLWATNAAVSGSVSGYLVAQNNGTIYAANGSGILGAFGSAATPLASTDYVTMQPGTAAQNPTLTTATQPIQINSPTGQNVGLSSGGQIVAEFGGVGAAPASTGGYALVGTRTGSTSVYFSAGGTAQNIIFQANNTASVYLLNQSGTFATFRNSDGNTGGASFDFQVGDATHPLNLNWTGTGMAQMTVGQAHYPVSVAIGGGSLASSATKGFLQIPYCAGSPTGVPNPATGGAPIVYDTTNHKLWIYDTVASAWKGSVFA